MRVGFGTRVGSGRWCLVRQCVCVHVSGADERLAAIYYRRGITLVHLQRAISLGCARKYVAMLNGSANVPTLVTNLNYCTALVEEVVESSAGEDYWKHTERKVTQTGGDVAASNASSVIRQEDEMRETK